MLKQKQLVIAVAVIILIALGLGGYFFLNKDIFPANQTSNTTTGQNKGNSAMNTLVNLLASNANVSCSFNMPTDENGYSGKGTVYLSSGNMRGDFVTTMDNKTYNMSMIRRGNDNYVWGDQMEGGIKMTLTPEDLKEEQNEASKYVDFNKEFDYRCTPWGVDSSKFNPPSNIKFTDVSEMMEQSKEMMKKQGTTYNSSICDSIEDASAKKACQNALEQ
ncbi:MAG: hypothetical protein HYT06_00200 [Candidatus Levybacteria bacterium]|nr:hypothetical protein [Candidatus Levybacteria bacterium]